MLLSIVIPSYNHEQFVLATIEAATQIGIQDKEIVVIDDGSSDASVGIIRDYIAANNKSDCVRLIARENRGLVRTLNEGLSLARGEFIYLVASDDIPIPAGVVSLVDILRNNSALQFVMGNALIMESEHQQEFRLAYAGAHRRFFDLPYDERQKEMFLHYPQPILLQSAVFRTSALKAIGGWREDIVSDDFSLFLQMFTQLKTVGKDFGFHPEIMACFYRRHETNISRNLERQFRTIEQALSHLCPSEWRDAAHLRNFALHGRIAVRQGRISLAARLLRTTLGRVGLFSMVHAASSVLRDVLTTRAARRRANQLQATVVHEPPVTRTTRPANAN